MTTSWKEQIQAWLEDNRAYLQALYNELHDMAELAWQEQRTTSAIAERLGALDLSVKTFPTHTGVIGIWEGAAPGRSVGLRADMDALWQQVDGQWRANHSCGHDAHMTMVYGAIRCLKEIGYEVAEGRLLAIFQPAEEITEGARALVKAGAIDGVDCLVGIHLRPLKELPHGQASSAIYHSGYATLTGTIRGKQAHAARPDEGVNAIEALAEVTTAIRRIRAGTPPVQGSCKVTTVRVPNESSNIIPDEATFVVDIRAATMELLTELGERIQRSAQQAAQQLGATLESELVIRAAPAQPDDGMERLVGEAIAELLGEQQLAPPMKTPGAEDFHFYKLERSQLRATVVGLGCGLTPGLHAPNMQFEREAILHGTGILALTAIKLLEAQQI